jgi:hypothetical protein
MRACPAIVTNAVGLLPFVYDDTQWTRVGKGDVEGKMVSECDLRNEHSVK